jgi:hypothetical protein
MEPDRIVGMLCAKRCRPPERWHMRDVSASTRRIGDRSRVVATE